MKIRHRLLLAVLTTAAAGCAATSEQAVPFPRQDVDVTRADHARIYFVRADRTGLQCRALRVFDGETEIGALTSDSYLCWERPAGRSVGRAFYEAIDPSRGTVDGIGDLNCTGGRAYFFNVQVAMEDGKSSIRPLSADAGRELVAVRKRAGDE